MNAFNPSHGAKPSHGAGDPEDKPNARSFLQSVRGQFASVLHTLTHKAWPVIRSAVTRAITAIVHTVQRIASLVSRLVADLRPSATSAGRATVGGASANMAHVYLVRRIVVFSAAALVILAMVLGIIFGVRALSVGSGADVDASGNSNRSQSADSADAEPASTDSEDSASNTDPEDPAANTDSTDPAQSHPPEPLTPDERADILAKAEQIASENGNEIITYTYCIASKGEVGDLTEFANTVYSTLNDPRGWPRAGAVFHESEDSAANACNMTLTLAAADQMTSFSAECSDEYSCRVGNDVIINIDRWNNATEDWLHAGGTVERYRTMVINHEVGHRLGHFDNELTCPAVNQPAPLMQQQSMDLLGCVPNEWPLDEELWVSE